MSSGNLQVFAGKIKELIQQKGGITKTPADGSEAIVVKEQKVGMNYTISVAIGMVRAINVRYFEIQGKVFDDTFREFTDSVMRIEPKAIATTKGADYVCAEFPPGIIRAADEATWAGNLKDLQNLITLLENYNP
jgi:hypothetical protein